MITLKSVRLAVLLGTASLSAPALSDDTSSPYGAGESAKTQSADAFMARNVSQYRRAMLDRGGWENPYLPSTASGNALASVSVGSGVTFMTSGREDVSGTAVEGAASGEPEEATEPVKR